MHECVFTFSGRSTQHPNAGHRLRDAFGRDRQGRVACRVRQDDGTPYTTLRVYALNPKPYTLHPTPFTLHPTPYTGHPYPVPPSILNPRPHIAGRGNAGSDRQLDADPRGAGLAAQGVPTFGHGGGAAVPEPARILQQHQLRENHQERKRHRGAPPIPRKALRGVIPTPFLESLPRFVGNHFQKLTKLREIDIQIPHEGPGVVFPVPVALLVCTLIINFTYFPINILPSCW